MPRLSCALLLAFLPCAAPAAHPEAGRLFCRVYLPSEYRGEIQISDVAQAPDGLIYAANLGAIKEYDGENWRSIPVPASWILDLEAARDGRVYIAGVDELGYLEAGEDGLRTFHSILHLVPQELKPLGQQWVVFWHDGGVYWSTNSTVLRWRDGRLRTWSFTGEARRVIHRGGRHVYLASTVEGLLRLENEQWQVVSTHELAKDLPRVVLDDWGSSPLMTLHNDGRMYTWDDPEHPQEWPTGLPEIIRDVEGARVSEVVRLRDGRLAVSTKNAGILVLDRQGDIGLRFGTEGALTVMNLFGGCEDTEGGLWIGSTNGMFRVEPDASLTVFDRFNGGPPGNMYRLARHEGRLYACGDDGIYRFEPGRRGAQGRFNRVETDADFVPYDLLSHPTGLLIATDRGLFRLADGGVSHEFSAPHSIYTLARSVTDPARIFVSGNEYLNTLRRDGDGWRDEGSVAAAKDDIRSIVEDEHGVLWMGTPGRGVARARRLPGREDWQSATVDHFDTDRGLPEGHDWVSVYQTAVGPLFPHARGVSVHDPSTDRFVPSAAFAAAGIGGTPVYPVAGGRGTTVWAQLGSLTSGEPLVLGRLRQDPAGAWAWEPLPERVYAELGYMGAGDFWWEAAEGGEGVLWILGQQNILRWELDGLRAAEARPAEVIFRSLRRGSRRLAVASSAPPELPFAREPLRASFASPHFAPGATVEYQHRLRGYDDRWSEWSREATASFTNLSGGDYTLEVRARRSGGSAGAASTWAFTVLPPWWWSAPAIIAYVVFAAGLAWFGLRWRVARLVRDRARLEELVRERTEELALARDRAESANRAKTRFLANMSHELRTPLHAILGYAQLLGGDRGVPSGARERLQIVVNSGRHLLRLINEVLDLAKIEAGKSRVESELFDLRRLLREVTEIQASRADSKGLRLRCTGVDGIPAAAVGDSQKLRQVLDNLLGNAIKFTTSGEVRIDVARADGEPGGDATAAGRLRFTVTDTGGGIRMPNTDGKFEPFVRGLARNPTNEGGSGLGLSIVEQLVTLMGGQLEVESEPGRGSTFRFSLPLLRGSVALPPGKPVNRRLGYEGPRRRVLAIDDEDANRRLYDDILGPLGFDVEPASSGAEAMEVLGRSQACALAIVDLRLPDIDGVSLVRALRADTRFRSMRILAASASVVGYDTSEVLSAGADAFIAKPFLTEEFLDHVGRLLELTWRKEEGVAEVRDATVPREVLEELVSVARMGDVIALRRLAHRLRESQGGAGGWSELERAIDAFDTDEVVRLGLERMNGLQQA